jgi:hypothetical protein
MSVWQQLSKEEEMHFYTSVNDVISAFKYHGMPAVLDEVFKDAVIRQQFYTYLTNTAKSVNISV